MLPTLLLLSTVTVAFGQHTMFLSRPTGVTYLSDIIMRDTLSNGARADSQRVYVLQRGGTWFWDGTITNTGWTLDIEAADTGSGGKAIIYGTPAAGTTSAPYQWVNVSGDVIVKNVIISGYFDPDTSAFNSYGGPFILFRCATPGPRMEFDGNVFSNVGQAVASAFAAVPTIKFQDNIIVNQGLPPRVDVGNGRVVDIRNVSVDSLVFINNTICYEFDRVARHIASVGRLNHFIFDHNTVYENGGRYGLIALGAVGASVQITNNLLIDPMAVGSDTCTKRQSDFKEMNEWWPDGKVKMAWIYNSPVTSDTLPGKVATNWDIAKNYWYVTPQIQAVWDSCVKMNWDPSLSVGRQLTDSIKSRIDTSMAFFKLDKFSFANVPAPFAGTVLWALKPISVGGTGGASSGGIYVPYDKRLTTYYADTMDCSYSTSSPAYTGGGGGFPAGDLNWFPNKKQQWLITGVKNIPTTVPAKFSLEQNYPNPFNPSTYIKVNLRQAGVMSLTVYNVLGQVVEVVDQGYKPAGVYAYNINMDRYASGVYFYTLRQGPNVITKKMLLLK